MRRGEERRDKGKGRWERIILFIGIPRQGNVIMNFADDMSKLGTQEGELLIFRDFV